MGSIARVWRKRRSERVMMGVFGGLVLLGMGLLWVVLVQWPGQHWEQIAPSFGLFGAAALVSAAPRPRFVRNAVIAVLVTLAIVPLFNYGYSELYIAILMHPSVDIETFNYRAWNISDTVFFYITWLTPITIVLVSELWLLLRARRAIDAKEQK